MHTNNLTFPSTIFAGPSATVTCAGGLGAPCTVQDLLGSALVGAQISLISFEEMRTPSTKDATISLVCVSGTLPASFNVGIVRSNALSLMKSYEVANDVASRVEHPQRVAEEKAASMVQELELLRSTPVVHPAAKEIRRIAFEDTGRQYETFQERQREATTDMRLQNEALVADLTSQIQALNTTLISQDKAIGRLEKSIATTQEAMNREDTEWEAAELDDWENGWWGEDGL